MEEDIIQLDENLKKHLNDKTMKLDEKMLKFKDIYDNFKKKNYFKKIDICVCQTYFLILYNGFIYIFFFKLIPVEFNFLYKEKIDISNISICSTYELFEYCQKYNYNPDILIDNNKYEFKLMFESFYISNFVNLNKIILVQDFMNYDDYKNEEITTDYPQNNSILEPDKLSKFFELFFKFEIKSNFTYWGSDKRDIFKHFIIQYKTKQNIYCLKICGPSSIGKSMTLFILSKYYNNFLYYNLKTIRILKEKNDNVNIQNIITESCKYLELEKEQIIELSSIIKNNKLKSFFYSLKEIVKFLIKDEIPSVIILDQFKNNSIDKEFYTDILSLISKQNNKKVKLLICSSTNDKEIREECIKSWKSKIFFLSQFNEENQDYYFYIDELYNKNKKGDSLYDNVLYNFNYIPKYKSKFEYLEKEENVTQKFNKDLTEIQKKIENNLKKLYEIINEKDKSEEIIMMRMIESLRYIFLNINEKINYEKLEEFTRICSFKYYTFKFENNYFMINYSFPYMIKIINNIINTHLEEFYQFKRKNEHSGFANADFFELFSGKSLKLGKLKLPESDDHICLEVNEIVKMNELSINELDDIIKFEIKSNLEKYLVKKEDFIEDNKEISKELKEINLLLNLNDIINYNDKNIEYYKLQYLNSLKNEYFINGNKKLGDMSIFINQKNQRGKKIDLAYVYGKKENKTFIGFQMKAYDEGSSHDCNFDSTRDNLKKVLAPMIVNIKYLMGMNIKYWHYVVIILLDKQKEEGKQFFKKIVERCQNNGLDYIFYEPYENQFYNRNLNQISNFIPNQFSNLDDNIENILPINIMNDINIDQYMENFSDYMIKKKLNNANYIEEGLISLLNKKKIRLEESLTMNKKKETIKKVINDILYNIKIIFNFSSIKFVGAYDFLNYFNIPMPKINYFFLVPSNENDIFLIIINQNNNNLTYYEYKMNLVIDNLKKNKEQKIITQVETNYIYLNIKKTEKFYAFKFNL